MVLINKIKFKNKLIYKIVFSTVSIFFSSSFLYGLPSINSVRSFDNHFRFISKENKFAFEFLAQGGFNVSGYNAIGNKVNALHYLSPDQNSLAMVKGFSAGTEQAAIAQQFNVGDDDGVRGHLVFTGTISMPLSVILSINQSWGDHWFVAASLPFYSMKLSNLQWIDQTQNVALADNLAKTLLTNNLAANVERLGSGLKLINWTKVGPGDLTVIGGYQHTFFQNKPWIKYVTINARSGFMLPTGLPQDEDLIMNFPFGNDQSVGLLVGAGLEVNFKQVIDAGIDVEFLHVFNNTRDRRIKVNVEQTDLLLLTKTAVQKDPGFFQKFNLYVQPKFCTGFSLLCAYQFAKRGKEHLYIVSNAYSSTIANSAESIKEWTMHSILVQPQLDFSLLTQREKAPQCSVFCKIPFNGARVVQGVGLGFTIAVNF